MSEDIFKGAPDWATAYAVDKRGVGHWLGERGYQYDTKGGLYLDWENAAFRREDFYRECTVYPRYEAPPMPADTKASNPKDAVGSDKLPLHLWPESATAYGCIGLLNGMLKYGRSNWREAGVRPSIYVDAAKRHLTDWFEGQDHDPEDGVHNLSAALACLAILVDSMSTGNMVDDRNYNGLSWRAARAEMEPHVKRLKALHAGRNPKHYTIGDDK